MPKSMKRCADLAHAISKGDMTGRLQIERKDELELLSESLNTMTANLHGMIGGIAGGVNTLTCSSTELAAISQSMSVGAEQPSQNRAGWRLRRNR